MNSKDRVLRLAQLERELRALGDDQFTTLIAALPEEAVTWVANVARGAGTDETIDITALRGAMSRGRLKGVPERVAAVLTDSCLQDCIEALGDKADFPSEDELRGVLAGLVHKHGVQPVRIMLASAVAGEAPASTAINRVLKTDPTLTLPQPAQA
jgi:hypothetical protein